MAYVAVNPRQPYLLAAAFVLAAGGAYANDLVSCPPHYKQGNKSLALTSADVFDGKPEELASLIPDLETYEWELDVSQRWAREHDDHLYLVCRYKGTDKTVTLKIPYEATWCSVWGTRAGTAAGCRVGRKPGKPASLSGSRPQ